LTVFIATRMAGTASGWTAEAGGFFELAANAEAIRTSMSTDRFIACAGTGYCKQVLGDVSLEPRFREWQAKAGVPKWVKKNANFSRRTEEMIGRERAQSLEWRRFLAG
jgi:hypothetical protein